MKKLNTKGFGAVEALLIVVIVGIIGGAGYMVYNSQKKTNESLDNAVNNVNSSSKVGTTDQKKTTESETLKYSDVSGKLSVTLTYPSTWSKTEAPTSYNPNVKNVSLKSTDGYYIHFFQPDGVGGSCDPDNDKYTLVKKIATQTENVYFTEYATESSGYPRTYLRVEDVSKKQAPHKGLSEGESNTGVCGNVSGYSSIFNDQGNSIFITISKKDNASGLSGDVSSEEASSNPELLKVLSSLKADIEQ